MLLACKTPQSEPFRKRVSEEVLPSTRSTYYNVAAADNEELTYSIDSGCMGTLTVTIGSTVYVYKLSDIVGRIEVTQ